ncbi:helix-turn-helix domain-containing protein [Thalassotalea fusca]
MIHHPLFNREPQVLVENKVSFAAENTELSIYDTYQTVERVGLSSDQLMFCGMLTGTKVMHANAVDIHQTFLPHESFVMAPNQTVEIDFPDAALDQPTTCLAIEISPERISKVANQLSIESPLLSDYRDWSLRTSYMHTHHSAETQALLNRMVHIFTENHDDREFLIDLAVTELSARLLRHQTRDFIVSYCQHDPEKNSINAVCHHILDNLAMPMNTDDLAKIACMSRTKFFTTFKAHMGCTPTAFQLQQRLKSAAKQIVAGHQITQVCFALGFVSPSHFSRSFKAYYGMTPNDYKLRHKSPSN